MTKYKGCQISIDYSDEFKSWSWTAHVNDRCGTGMAAHQAEAEASARAFVDAFAPSRKHGFRLGDILNFAKKWSKRS